MKREYGEVVQRIIKQNKLVGMFVAKAVDNEQNEIMIGFSLCSKKDKFRKADALDLAWGRAITSLDRGLKLPVSIEKDFLSFLELCKRYYKVPEDKSLIFPKYHVYSNNTRSYIGSVPIDLSINHYTSILNSKRIIDQNEEHVVVTSIRETIAPAYRLPKPTTTVSPSMHNYLDALDLPSEREPSLEDIMKEVEDFNNKHNPEQSLNDVTQYNKTL